MKEFLFEDCPKELIFIRGIVGQNNLLTMTTEAYKALINGRLKLQITKHGQRSSISNTKVFIGAVQGKVSIAVAFDDSEISIGAGCKGIYDLRMWRLSRVVIGDNNTSNGIRVVCDDSEFITGSDCMFSNHVIFQTADQHGIVDTVSGEIVNNFRKKTEIGDHVWCGWNSTVLSGLHIGSGSIIGIGSVVTIDIPSCCIAAGVPARIVKKNRTWSRSPEKLDCFANNFIEKHSEI